jgi:magnesium-transporting ATPase (P-type)
VFANRYEDRGLSRDYFTSSFGGRMFNSCAGFLTLQSDDDFSFMFTCRKVMADDEVEQKRMSTDIEMNYIYGKNNPSFNIKQAGVNNFSVDAIQLSLVMDPKAIKSNFDAVGGSAKAIAEAIGTDLTTGLSGSPEDLERRIQYFGGNYFAEKKLPSYIGLVWDGLQDTIITMLIMCAIIGLILSLTIDGHHGGVPGWVEPMAILVTVMIVVNITGNSHHWRLRYITYVLTLKLIPQH